MFLNSLYRATQGETIVVRNSVTFVCLLQKYADMSELGFRQGSAEVSWMLNLCLVDS